MDRYDSYDEDTWLILYPFKNVIVTKMWPDGVYSSTLPKEWNAIYKINEYRLGNDGTWKRFYKEFESPGSGSIEKTNLDAIWKEMLKPALDAETAAFRGVLFTT